MGGRDPFTGGGRYVPGGAAGGPSSFSSGGTDPFTGGSSYMSSAAATAAAANTATTASPFFPQVTPLRFDTFNAAGLATKLQECSGKVQQQQEQQLSEEEAAAMVAAVGELQQCSEAVSASLEKALQWPVDIVWPALDVLRLILRSEQAQQRWLTGDKGPSLMALLLSLLGPPAPTTTRLLAMRCLANMAAHGPGQALLASHASGLAVAVATASPFPNKNLEIAAATLLLNLSVICGKLQEDDVVQV